MWLRRLGRPPIESAFGSLERTVLELVWQRGEVSVREVHHALGGSLAYTTLMTTLDRLYKKGVLSRRKAGRAFLYSAAASAEQIERSLARGLLEGFLAEGSHAARPLLSTLVDVVGESDRRLLDELEGLVREKRRQLGRGGGR